MRILTKCYVRAYVIIRKDSQMIIPPQKKVGFKLTFALCRYDTVTRLWDTRCGSAVVKEWEEPHDEAVYALATDAVNTVVTGTARHGRIRVWDIRYVRRGGGAGTPGEF